ncbi:MAG: hypothetical protein PHX08_17180, partial [Lachnospiraceae bacterium]|nr:hypothetical protein [Lachnospiraceae bacterium]
MNKDELMKQMIFENGNPLSEQFSKYFVGKAYLNMLTTTGVSIGSVKMSIYKNVLLKIILNNYKVKNIIQVESGTLVLLCDVRYTI